MKQKSIDLLTAFLNSQIEKEGFTFWVKPINDLEQHWHFEVGILDYIAGKEEVILKFKVDYYDDSLYLEMEDGYFEGWERVEEDRWTVKYFWIAMYCAK